MIGCLAFSPGRFEPYFLTFHLSLLPIMVQMNAFVWLHLSQELCCCFSAAQNENNPFFVGFGSSYNMLARTAVGTGRPALSTWCFKRAIQWNWINLCSSLVVGSWDVVGAGRREDEAWRLRACQAVPAYTHVLPWDLQAGRRVLHSPMGKYPPGTMCPRAALLPLSCCPGAHLMTNKTENTLLIWLVQWDN